MVLHVCSEIAQSTANEQRGQRAPMRGPQQLEPNLQRRIRNRQGWKDLQMRKDVPMHNVLLQPTSTNPLWPWLRETLQAARGKGNPLDGIARRMLELFFGRDLSAVHIHHDA